MLTVKKILCYTFLENKTGRETTMRLNKYLSDIGYCSRREADRLIEAGKVYVDGVQAEMSWKTGRSDTAGNCGKS